MQFIKRNIWTLAAMVLFVTLATVGDAAAVSGGDLVTVAKTKTVSVFENVKTIVFVLGGFGLVGVAFAAIFGKLNWKWFAALAVGLAILAAANAIVQYAAGSSVQTGITDTFGA